MTKKKTALQNHIAWLEKSLSQCKPFAPAIPFIQMSINNAKELLPTEREQIEQAAIHGARIVLGMNTPDLKNIASDYFAQNYETE